MTNAALKATGDPAQRVTLLAKRSKAVSSAECVAYAALLVVGIEPSAPVAAAPLPPVEGRPALLAAAPVFFGDAPRSWPGARAPETGPDRVADALFGLLTVQPSMFRGTSVNRVTVSLDAHLSKRASLERATTGHRIVLALGIIGRLQGKGNGHA